MLKFDEARQSAFASLAGDFNPLHVDAQQARRSQFGGCVVHGVHLVLAALDSLGLSTPCAIVKLDAQFRSAVMVGESVSFLPEWAENGDVRISVSVGTQVRTVVLVELAPVASIGSVAHRAVWPSEVLERPKLDALAGAEGSDQLALDAVAYARLFPSLSGMLGRSDAAMILGITRVVGMQCPGHWALFRRLAWQCALGQNPDGSVPDAIHYRVSVVDPRFSMVTLAMSMAARTIRAEVIVRQPPPRQIDLGGVCSRVPPDRFSGARALIVGGSRGLGELAAKVMIAGGAEVLLTYRTGAEDAARVVAELGPRAAAIQYYAEAPEPEILARMANFASTHLAYFATPVIAVRPPYSWDPPIFDKFIQVYVIGLSRLLATLHSRGTLKRVFYPSTTFIDELPAGFGEYIAAKIACEAMCAAWQRLHPDQKVVMERLPPMVTDQTSAKLHADPAGNLDILLPALLRTMD